MRLRTTAGRYAGEIREYDLPVGLAALRAGTAERLDAAPAKPSSKVSKKERQAVRS